MRGHRLAAVARKEVIQIVRDWRSLAIVLVLPVVMTLLFGYGVSLDLKHIPIYVLDREGSRQSRELVERFRASEYFRIEAEVDEYAAVVAGIDAGRCRLAVVVPHDFSKRLAMGGPVGVQAIVDATDDNTANVVLGYAEGVVGGYSAEVMLEWLQRSGQKQAQPPLAVEARTWYNEDLESSAFIVPGVLALVMAVVGTFLTSLTIAREWERGTMEQLVSTPVTPLELLVGKLAPYFVIGMVATGVCVAIGILWFEVPFRGSFLTLFLCAALFLVVVLSQGFFISVVTKNQLAASQVALISTFLPAFLLSGFLFAIEQMPRPIQLFTHIVPARYYVTVLKGIFLKGATFELLRLDVASLAVFAFLLALVATRAFHKRLG
jgi:ABC-2 type transport system permease protein